MEHEWDWPVFESPLIYERGKRRGGGKKSKERATWAFFVTASGEKDTPIVVGRSLSLRCFKSSKNGSRLCKCDYFSGSRVWMASEIFQRVSFEADELTARVDTYSCFLTTRLVTPISLSTASGIWRWLFCQKRKLRPRNLLMLELSNFWKWKERENLSQARSTDRKQSANSSTIQSIAGYC